MTRLPPRAYLPSVGLGITQVVGYGTLMYAYAILLPRMAADLDLTLAAVFGVLSLALFFGGMLAPLAGAVIGPFKTVGRFLEMLVSRNLYPMVTYALSLGLMMSGFVVLLGLGVTVAGVVLAAALYGMGDGIKTIARGTLPLALFGQPGYGARLGWISFVQMGMNSSAPFVFAWMTQVHGGWASFAAMAAVLNLAIATYFLIPDPRKAHATSPQDRCRPAD